MTQEHPITPPLELLKHWEEQHFDEGENYDVMLIQAYQAGADQELEACSQWIHGWYGNGSREVVGNLYAARRPKPLSLKEQALESVKRFEKSGEFFSYQMRELEFIRKALEQLND